VSDAQGPTTLAERGHRLLRAGIICGRHPPATRLRIEDLRETYAMGASPLREALNRLAAEGFVVAIGQRGFRVAPVSVEDLRDITRVRILLETEALTESIRCGDDAWEARVVAAFHRLSKLHLHDAGAFSDYEPCNHEFHEALVAACRSPLLLRYRAAVYDQHRRYRSLSLHTPHPARDLQREHRAIFEAALGRDAPGACAATGRHIRGTAERIERLFDRLRAQDAATPPGALA